MKNRPLLYGKRVVLSSLVFSALSMTGNAASIFNFDADAMDEGTPFTDVSNGLSANFSSPGDPGGFGVTASFFSTLSGNVLIDPGPAGLDNLALNIGFSNSVDTIGLDFAVNAASPVPLTLTAFENGATVGTVTATGALPAGFPFPEGHVGFSGAVFDSVTLTGTATDLAIDNVTVSSAVAATPEPATLGLMSLAGIVASLGVMAKRRRRR